MSTNKARLRKRRSLVENHYNIDEATFRLLGALSHDKNLKRDVHDVFNLIALVIVLWLDALNWDWSLLLSGHVFKHGLESCWVGDKFENFFNFSIAYFAVDLVRFVWHVPSDFFTDVHYLPIEHFPTLFVFPFSN